MEQVILSMLKQYKCVTDDDFENALKQIMQQIVLLGLWRSKFFEHAAFYGGTSLRILYGLNRFSEDLDFSLLKTSDDFNRDTYFKFITYELEAFGFSVDIVLKKKSKETAIQSAFLKANTQHHLVQINAPKEIQVLCHAKKLIKIKIEIDTTPAIGFNVESKPLLNPIPFWVNTFCLPDLFAGKLAAVLCRQWKTRVKGRDWYDFIWFIQNQVPVHLSYCENILRSSNYYTDKSSLDEKTLKTLLLNKIDTLDINLAKEDISKFISNSSILDGWRKPLFKAIVTDMLVC